MCRPWPAGTLPRRVGRSGSNLMKGGSTMTRMAACLGMVALLGLLAGCETTGKYDAEKCCIAGYTGTVHCDKCDQDVPAGKWCGKCNRFMIPGDGKCACGAEAPMGSYCEKCDAYVGLPHMAYCKGCNKPYDKAKGCCPGCAEKCEKKCEKTCKETCKKTCEKKCEKHREKT